MSFVLGSYLTANLKMNCYFTTLRSLLFLHLLSSISFTIIQIIVKDIITTCFIIYFVIFITNVIMQFLISSKCSLPVSHLSINIFPCAKMIVILDIITITYCFSICFHNFHISII